MNKDKARSLIDIIRKEYAGLPAKWHTFKVALELANLLEEALNELEKQKAQ